jgi:hypothetical protein
MPRFLVQSTAAAAPPASGRALIFAHRDAPFASPGLAGDGDVSVEADQHPAAERRSDRDGPVGGQCFSGRIEVEQDPSGQHDPAVFRDPNSPATRPAAVARPRSEWRPRGTMESSVHNIENNPQEPHGSVAFSVKRRGSTRSRQVWTPRSHCASLVHCWVTHR